MESGSTPAAPQEFMCPLSHRFMTDPVVSVHGETFQREAILTWLEMDGDYCPFSGKPMSRGDLIPNYALRTRIQAWTDSNEVNTTLVPGDRSVQDEAEGAFLKRLGISNEIEVDCDKFRQSVIAAEADMTSIDEVRTISSVEKFPIQEITTTTKKSRRVSSISKALFKLASVSV